MKKKYFHSRVAGGILNLATVFFLLFIFSQPNHGLGYGDFFMWLLVSRISVQRGITRNSHLLSYGVAADINQIVGAGILPDFGKILFGGLVVKPQLSFWGYKVFYLITLTLIALLQHRRGWSGDAFTIHLILLFVSALGVAFVLEVYVWFFEQRYVCWFCPEPLLRQTLEINRYSEKEIQSILEKVRGEKLLF
jgi:hypothetical protein